MEQKAGKHLTVARSVQKKMKKVEITTERLRIEKV